jgi:hypothetical protein
VKRQPVLHRMRRQSELGRKGIGYGSEWHFEHYRRVLPDVLNAHIRASIGKTDMEIDWVYPTLDLAANEPRGLEFLKAEPRQRKAFLAWRAFWPQTGKNINWDGVARDVNTGEWLMFEAKANHPEFCSSICTASQRKSRKRIESAHSKAKRHLNVHRDFQWLGTYYQYANRLTCLYFLNILRKIPARLILIYFIGDKFPEWARLPLERGAMVRIDSSMSFNARTCRRSRSSRPRARIVHSDLKEHRARPAWVLRPDRGPSRPSEHERARMRIGQAVLSRVER